MLLGENDSTCLFLVVCHAVFLQGPGSLPFDFGKIKKKGHLVLVGQQKLLQLLSRFQHMKALFHLYRISMF
uniref:Uncharacterized protein n=1 Tax=Rhizophora mucronata TaxID=61149 RepID=A0A2P2QDJ0_RHIMU